MLLRLIKTDKLLVMFMPFHDAG